MSIFSKVAMPKPAQNTFDLSHDRKFSMKIGEITPILCQETVQYIFFLMLIYQISFLYNIVA